MFIGFKKKMALFGRVLSLDIKQKIIFSVNY